MNKKQSYNDFKKRVVYKLGEYKIEKFPEITDGSYNSTLLNYAFPKSNIKDNLMQGVVLNDKEYLYEKLRVLYDLGWYDPKGERCVEYDSIGWEPDDFDV